MDENATTEESSVVRQEGRRRVRRKIKFYNLDAIISVGYRVDSKKGTRFRIWATQPRSSRPGLSGGWFRPAMAVSFARDPMPEYP